MSCGSHGHGHGRASRRAEIELMKQQQRQLWTAALSGAVTGAVSGARGATAAPQVRIGDTERDSAVAALSEHYVAGRLSKDELDERTDAAWSARTSGDLARLFSDLPQLPPAVPARPERRRPRRDPRLGWVVMLLVVLVLVLEVPWFVLAIVAGVWWLVAGLSRGVIRG